MAESSGEFLGGRYRLLGERTSFPFGAWWEAEDDQGARTVVLRMNAEVAEPAAKAKAAVAATASLDSAHIVPWADGGVDAKGQGWLAAPMFGPWSLTEHVTRTEGIPPAEAAPLMHQVVRAVAAGEAVGVAHNTLTSEFVRLVPLPEGGYGMKVYGFGLSDLLPSYKPLRKQDAYLGVPDYMSPELCSGKAAEGASADIYALGIIMYEAVRGRPPFAPTFASASASTTLKRHIFEKPLPLHVRYANAPFIKTYENICFKALAKTANRRQLTVAEFEKELEALIVDEMRSQVVSLAAVSGRGPSTSRRLRTQVIAQIPVDEPKVVVKPEPKPAAVVVQKAAEPAPAARPAEPVKAAVSPSAADAGKAAVAASSADAGKAPVAASSADAGKAAVSPSSADAGKAAVSPSSADAGKAALSPSAADAGKAALSASSAEPVRALEPMRAPEPEPDEPDDDFNEPEAAETPSSPRRGDSTLVFAGLGPAVRELAEAARKADEDEEGTGEDEAEPIGAQPNPNRKGKKGKKGRKATGVSHSASTQQAIERPEPVRAVAAAAVSTTPSSATIMTSKVSEAATGEGAGTAAGAKGDPSGARIRKKDEATTVTPPKSKPAKGKDEEEWFGDEETTQRKNSKVWIFLLLAAAVVIVVVILLMSGGKNDGAPVGSIPAGITPTAQRYRLESEPLPAAGTPSTAAVTQPAPAAVPAPVVEVVPTPEPPKTVEASATLTAAGPAVAPTPPTEPVKIEPVKAEPAKVEPVAKVEPAKTEPTRIEPAKVEPTKMATPTKVEPAKVEPKKVEPKVEPAKVEPKKVEPKVEPAKVETPAKVDPPGSPEDQFRAKAKHYIELGMQAYKSENYKLAIGYFKKAQEADPTNIQASRYLKQAQEKAAQ